MAVVILGGYGQFGLPTAKQLVNDPLVDEVVIAGRDASRAAQAATEVGPRARALRLDADDPGEVRAALGPGDVLLSMMWDHDRYLEPLAGAAVRAGAHYCDMGSPLPSETLDAAARAAGVTVLIGVGSSPGLTELTQKWALGMLDEVDHTVTGFVWAPLQDIWDDLYRAYVKLPGDLDRGPHGRELRTVLAGPASVEERLAALRDGLVVELNLTRLVSGEKPAQIIPVVRDGRLVLVDPVADGVDVPLVTGGFTSVPVLYALPDEAVAGAPSTYTSIPGLSRAFVALIHVTAARVRADELTYDEAVAEVRDALASDLDAHLLDPALFARLPGEFCTAYGRSSGRSARASTWFPQQWYTPQNWLDMTAANVAMSVTRLLNGRITERGALRLADADTLDEAYLAELESRMPFRPAGVPFVDRGLELLG
jgi:hypothetical protein